MTRAFAVVILTSIFSSPQPGQTPAVGVFKARVEAARRIDAARTEITDPEARAEMALHWAEALDRAARAVPFGRAATTEPYASWLKANQRYLAYNEPGGHWMLRRNTILNLHRLYPAMAAADDIAWLLVTVGIGGECEGYLPCYVGRQDVTYGEYLRLHPEGRHADDAMVLLGTWLRSALLDAPQIKKMFVPAEHCGELKTAVAPLRAAVTRSKAYRHEDVERTLDELLEWCR